MASAKDDKKSVPVRWHDVYDDIPVGVSAEWDAFELTLRDLSNLEVDDVIEMSPSLIGDTKLRIEDRTCFIGEMGSKAIKLPSSKREYRGCRKINRKNHG